MIPDDHRYYLELTGYRIRDAVDPLTPEQSEYLRRYGYWLDALVNVYIYPITQEQRRFLAVAQGEREPGTLAEHAWVALRGSAPPLATAKPSLGYVGGKFADGTPNWPEHEPGVPTSGWATDSDVEKMHAGIFGDLKKGKAK